MKIIVANANLKVEFCNKSLVEAHSKLRVCLQAMEWYVYIYQLSCFSSRAVDDQVVAEEDY